ncbi:MAG: protein kinase [Acidobacteriota bacterium]|nr:protein kinase [Acidobacteriota bacterium]
MNDGSLVGQMLDGKYKIEREIGKGGMGTVYLATHVGTERPVALKVIASEFMQRLEFVERFRREARAAGRLRHPNVVNVTDFGFARTKTGEAAYLVMEYLDGCTLGEVLEEEKRLPLSWTLDILEQVCSAVQEAHEQGIIHRDLKPDNIWLEPNQRGGYTVKVLDFGIAKLEEQIGDAPDEENLDISIAPNFHARPTIADHVQTNTIADNQNSTVVSEAATIAQFAKTDLEAGTMIQSSEVDLESGTAIFSVQPIRSLRHDENAGTKLISEQIKTSNHLSKTPSTSELTRVGAVLGTPLYMSPEQCRGEKLTAQSDIYSLGVIAYQMLSGKTPFSGDYLEVMEAHKVIAPPPLAAKKVRKKVKRVINSALSKNIEDRPPTAQAFAAELRAESEGIRALLRRALMIYSEHLGKFLGLSALLYAPVAFLTVAQIVLGFLALSDTVSETTKVVLNVLISLVTTFLGMFCMYLILGTTTWLVTQILAVPLRPVSLRPALETTRRKWKTFAGTGMMSSTFSLIGYALCLVPGVVLSVLTALVGPVVMMENLRGFAALKRSKTLVKRSLRTTTFTIFIMFFVPLLSSVFIAFMANAAVKSFTPDAEKTAAIRREVLEEIKNENKPDENLSVQPEKDESVKININGREVKITDPDEQKDMGGRIRGAVREALTQILLLPLQIIIGSFSSIVIALLYLKTRQVGGESMQDLLAQFEEADQPRTNWQRRVHERLEQTSKHTSKN